MESTKQLLDFINELLPNMQLDQILVNQDHPGTKMQNWVGLKSLVCTNNSGIYDVDIRWTNSDQVFKQQLFDYGWTEELLLAKRKKGTKRHKLIIYCAPKLSRYIHPVPTEFLVSQAWASITHVYTSTLPPFPIDPAQIAQVTTSDCYAPNSHLTTNTPAVNRPFAHRLMASDETHGGLRTQGLFKDFDPRRPAISIVTVVYNGEKYLEQTIQSVINQSYDNLEYIIVDGGSTDRTLEVIAKYNNYINYWVSAPDHGIYPAMNKGTRLATGSHILHLNADDLFFAPDGLEFLAKSELTENHMRSMLKLDLSSGQVVKDPAHLRGNNLADNVTYSDPFLRVCRTAMAHPSFVGQINAASIFNEEYRISSDTVMLIQKLLTESVRLSSQPLSIFRSGGASSDNKPILAEMWNEIKNQPGIWPKIAIWLQLQGIFPFWK
jgi:Glycosyl transferase family 2